MMKRSNVQVYILSNDKSKLLMLKRIPEKSSYWQPVCGGVESGETIEDAGKREVFEETGITSCTVLKKLPFRFDYVEAKNGIQMKMKDECILMRIDLDIEISLSEEHEEYKWCNLDEVKYLTDWDPILEVVNYLMETQ